MTYRKNLDINQQSEVDSEFFKRRPFPRGKGALQTIQRPDPEVPEKKQRRNFTAQYKRRILEEADACTESGQIGALLRREGIYSSYLTTWRNQREKGILNQFSSKKGRKKKPVDPEKKNIADLEKENTKLREELKKAETIIEFQKKISEMLGIAQDQKNQDDQNS